MRLKVILFAMMVCAMLASATVMTLVAVLAAPHIETMLHVEAVAPAPEQSQPVKMTHPAMFQESGPAIQHPNHDPDHRGGGCKHKKLKTDDL